MKWLIASDIHGSAYYCEKLLEAYRREGADKMLLLGDILYHGPRNDLPKGYAPKQVIAMLNPLAKEILCVRGNCDAEVDQMVLDFPIMADYAFLTADGNGNENGDNSVTIFATHGHIYNTRNVPAIQEGDILLHGHTHVPACEQQDGYMYLNPGSVSIPKENSPHSYMVFDGKNFEWKVLDGEREGEVYENYTCCRRDYSQG